MQIGFALFNALAVGMAIFLVAAGITLIFGMLRILNISHGSIFMVGAYIAFTVVGTEPGSISRLLVAGLVAGGVLAAAGLCINFGVFRRLRHVDEAYSLIATFAMLMICNGVVKLIWDVNYHSVSAPDALAGAVFLGPVFVPTYSLFIIGMGIATFLALEILIHRSRIGKVVRAIAHDEWMSNLAGINTPLVYALVVMAAFFLAGMAGGMLLPNQSVSPLLFESYLLQSFMVVIIGGLGNIRGAFIASVMLGLVDGMNFLFMPELPGLLIYFLLVTFLLWRPQGLFWQPGANTAGHTEKAPDPTSVPSAMPIRLSPQLGSIIVLVAVAVASMPLYVNEGFLFVAGIAMMEALLALSWNFLFGYVGLATFGHAAFFGIGAYFVGFLLRDYGISFPLLLAGATVLGGLCSMIIGLVALRRTSGIALGILTLSLGEILRRVINYSKTLGSDDGLSGIPRPALDFGLLSVDLSSERAYFWFLCIACTAVAFLLWALTVSRFGRMMVSTRQDPLRAEFLGINVQRVRLTSFAISGAVAALAGALHAPWAQIVVPDAVSYLHSTQPMLNTLLGGSGFFWGPVVGSVAFSTLGYATRTLAGLSELISGLIVLAVVLGAPGGILGIGRQLGIFRAKRAQAGSPDDAREGARP